MISVGHRVPSKDKAVLVSSGDVRGKVDMLDCCQMLDEAGYKLYATEGTAKFLESNGVKVSPVCWPDEEGENILDLIANHHIDMVINIPKNHSKRELTNGYRIRRSAIDHNIPLLTNARLAAAYIRAFINKPIEDINIAPWSEY